MSESDFEALVTLIRNMIRYQMEMRESLRDGPRMRRVYREEEQAIEHARSILVL